jgi:hypothetical protein
MIFSAFLFVGVMVAPSSSPPAPQEAPATLAGSWERDPEQSDDASEKMRAALEQMREQMEKRRGGFGGPPPDGAGEPGGPERGGGPSGRRRPGGGVAAVPDDLRVELGPGELRVDDGERVQIYYLDAKKHLRELPNGTKLETTTTVEGGAVHIEEKMDRDRIERTIALGPDGKTMISTLNVKMKGMKQPVVIRTVYARIEGGNL